jgi:hypothetical protein
LLHQGINPVGQPVEDLDSVKLGEGIGQFLSGSGVVQSRECIVAKCESQSPLKHLLGQPGVAVDIHLDCEREPGRQADVDQIQLGIEEVKVRHTLLSACVVDP